MKTTTREVVVTPQMANEMLEKRDERQRRINPGVVEQMARDMRAHRWNESVCGLDPVVISDEGTLMNAQHRLSAIVKTGIPLKMTIVSNVPREDFEFIDGGKQRQTSQFITGNNAKNLAATARFANCVENGRGFADSLYGHVGQAAGNRKTSASTAEILEYFRLNEEVLTWCSDLGMKVYRSYHKGGSAAAFSDAIWVISKIYGRANAESFVDAFMELPPKSKAIAKAKDEGTGRIIDAKTQRVLIGKEYWFELMLSTFYGWISHRTLPQKTRRPQIVETFRDALN